MSTTESKNSNLQRAKSAHDDEFYTRLEDIEKELRHYSHHFKDKTVFLNCDDPYESDFFKYFAMNFNHLGLKKLISVGYAHSPIVGSQVSLFDIAGTKDTPLSKEPYKVEITEVPDFNGDGAINLIDVEELLKSDANTISTLKGDGDFRSDESVELLKQSDIVVTNPPFSLFREFISQLIEYDKKFVVLGNMNAIAYKEIWPLIQDNRIWLGSMPSSMSFRVPPNSPPRKNRYWVDDAGQKWRSLGNAAWFTNLDHARRHDEVPLFRRYSDNPAAYPKYENFDAIEVGRVADIPVDYEGNMGVPITFLGKHNPDQFEIVGDSRMVAKPMSVGGKVIKDVFYSRPDGTTKYPYRRIIVRRKK